MNTQFVLLCTALMMMLLLSPSLAGTTTEILPTKQYTVTGNEAGRPFMECAQSGCDHEMSCANRILFFARTGFGDVVKA